MIKKITSLWITMFSINKSKSNTNINEYKNSAVLAAKKGGIDFLYIDNSHLHFISTDVSLSRLFMLRLYRVPSEEVPYAELVFSISELFVQTMKILHLFL